MQGLMFGQAAPAERFAWLVGEGASKTSKTCPESLVETRTDLFRPR